MSFQLPSDNTTVSRRTATVHDHQRANNQTDLEYHGLCAELRGVAKKQEQRIQELKHDTAVRVEHQAALNRLELEERKSEALRRISELTPRLESVRERWDVAKRDNHGFETQWGAMRAQFQEVKQRVDALRDQIADGKDQLSTSRDTSEQMREQLQKLERDKAAVRSKLQRVLECTVVDNRMLETRIEEERQYHRELARTLEEVRREYEESLTQHSHELAPLKDDVQSLTGYLKEMEDRTQELHRYCLDLEAHAATAEEEWQEAIHSRFESLECAVQLDKIKTVTLKMLETEIEKHAGTAPRAKNGNNDSFWLSHAQTVWERIVNEVSAERSKMQVRDDSTRLLAETSQRCETARSTLVDIRSRVEQDGSRRRLLLQEISELHYVAAEKKQTEDQLVRYVQEVATQLDEDLSRVVTLLRRETFDDYVSTTEDGTDDDDDDDADDDALAMQVEQDDDIAEIVSSLDLDPADPKTDARVRRQAHRPQGPLVQFAVDRRKKIQRGVAQRTGVIAPKPRREPRESLERVLMSHQIKVAGEVIRFIRERRAEIDAGRRDPRDDRLHADPKYVVRAKDASTRMARWVQEQKEAPGRPIALSGQKAPDTTQSRRILVEGSARPPPEIERGNLVTKVAFYTTHFLRGGRFMMYPRRSMQPELRHIFLSRDLRRVIARRVADGDPDEMTLSVGDISNVLLGHRTDVFKDVRAVSRYPLREELALSLVTAAGTLDLECDTTEDRAFWASVFVWVLNESRAGGALHSLVRAEKIQVVDTLGRSAGASEVKDRAGLAVHVASDAL